MMFIPNREVKRVPKDFNYPLEKVWYGYINPYSGGECPCCDGTGYSEAGIKYKDDWYNFNGQANWSWINDNTRYDLNAHQYNLEQYEVDALWESGRLRFNFDHKPTAQEVNEWYRHDTLGHDSLNLHICMTAWAKKNGIEITCKCCDGTGCIRDEERFQNWKRIEPPKGDWYQLWETTSAGSPKTPPFETIEELAKYCVDNKISTFADCTLTYEEWIEFLKNLCETE